LKLLTPKEVAKILGMNEATIERYSRTGSLVGLQLGSRWRYQLVDVEKFIEQQKPPEKTPANLTSVKKLQANLKILPIDELLTTKQVAEILSVNTDTIKRYSKTREYCNYGELMGFKLGGRWRYELIGVKIFIETQKEIAIIKWQSKKGQTEDY